MTSEDIIRKWIEDLATMDKTTQDKGCYANSQRFAQAYPGVKYYEGFRFGRVVVQGRPIIPDRAWNIVDGDQVVEWANRRGRDERSPVYFGVEVPVEFTLGTPLLGWYLRLKEGIA
jgi:hypothetical protein